MTKESSKKRWVLVLLALITPMFCSIFYFIWFPGTLLGKSLYGGVKAFTLIWPFIAVWWLLKEKLVDDPRPKKHRQGIIEGTIFGVVTSAALLGLVYFTPLGGVLEENRGLVWDKVNGFGLGTPLLFTIFAILISFVHSALEEFFWRVYCFGQLRKLVNVALAVLIAGIGFSLHHIVVLTEYIPMGLAILFGAFVGVGGAVWSIIMHRTNSVWGIWISHIIVDLAIMWVGYELLFLKG